jgi:LAO/AO transport system kinase
MSLIDRVLAGEPAAVARALSVIESGSSRGDSEGTDAERLLAAVRPRIGRALRLGITGAPGAGKSTLTDRVIAEYRRQGARVAVLAVDPSSSFSGGAILGDRVRMQTHAQDDGVFIRSMATRGQLGGLARATAEAADVLDAAGFAVVIIETVGVGQAEIDIARAADVTLVVVAPGAGDEVQAMKAGIMEIADIFVVNKADREGADATAAAIERMLGFQSWADGEWRPAVVKTIATEGDGIAVLMEAIARFSEERRDAVAERRRTRTHFLDASSDGDSVVLDHVGVAINDAGALADLLRSLFGVPTGTAETIGVHRVRFVETGLATVELVESLSVDSPIAKFLRARGTALHHICLRVPDIDAALARLKDRGVRLIDEVPRAGAHGSRIAFLHPSGTGGILIELKG